VHYPRLRAPLDYHGGFEQVNGSMQTSFALKCEKQQVNEDKITIIVSKYKNNYRFIWHFSGETFLKKLVKK